MKLTPDERIVKSKIAIQRRYPFYAYIVLHLREKATKSIPTMAIDPTGRMYYNPDWVAKQRDETLIAGVCHEALHVIFSHFLRVGSREKMLWNVATDAQINNLLMEEGFNIPDDWIRPQSNTLTLPSMLKPIVVKDINKKNSEKVYEEIYTQAPKIKIPMKGQGKGKGKGQGGQGGGQGQMPQSWDGHIFGKKGQGKDKNSKDGKGQGQGGGSVKGGDLRHKNDPTKEIVEMSEKEIRELEDKWKDILVEAATFAKQRGKLPAGIGRLIEDLLEPEFNWRALLYKYITNAIPCDFTWSKPGRKSISTGIYLPDTIKEKLEVVVGVDVSGSVGQREYAKFIAEVIGIAKSFPSVEMTFLPWDTSVTADLQIANGNIDTITKWKVVGGGGTDINCVLRYLNEKKTGTKLFVCLTDGYFGRIDQDTPYDIVWVLTPHHSNNIPEGDVQIVMKNDE